MESISGFNQGIRFNSQGEWNTNLLNRSSTKAEILAKLTQNLDSLSSINFGATASCMS